MKGMRILLTGLAYIVSLALVAVAAFFAVILLAGPHSGLLPEWLKTVVLALGWLAVLVLPVVLARMAWRRMARGE